MRELKSEGARYQIQQACGQGQTATVFRAIRVDSRGHSRSTVALKILRNRTAVSWLKREFETLSQINSPHCVRVLGWENVDDGPALVLEWIDGLTLLEISRIVALETAERTEIIAQIASGLQALHDAGLHHGDLSLSNVLVDRRGQVRLIDFATGDREEDGLNGTPAYLAPEVWSGSQSSAGSDLFALGLIEHDLNFRSPPATPDRAKERASRLADSSALLATDAKNRFYLGDLPREIRQRGLGETVAALMDRLSCEANRTAVASEIILKVKPVNVMRSRIACSIALLLITAAAPSGAQAPAAAPPEKSARLTVRTQRWMEISVNGAKVGFTPVEKFELKPGSHRITWRTATMAGEKRVTVREGERVWLSEAELLGKH